ncbi:MAG: hypothetical protein ACLUEQ_05210 [Cloacibacillus evryensis]
MSDIIFNGTPEELAHTKITQPAILTVSVAMLRARTGTGDRGGTCLHGGGSLGEYTALSPPGPCR